MATLLLLDASSALCSVSLIHNQQRWHLCEAQPRRHAQCLLPMVDDVLQQAGVSKKELKGVAYGRGPGSFTGIRIAAAVMQGIALALALPVYGVSSLQALAQARANQGDVQPGEKIAAIMNAHMGEVFWGIYQLQDCGLVALMGAEQVATPEVCLQQLAEFQGMYAGDGLSLDAFASTLLTEPCMPDIQPQTESMCDAVLNAWHQQEFGAEEQHTPVYLRDSVAWKKLDEQPSLLKR